jgi:predicted porin
MSAYKGEHTIFGLLGQARILFVVSAVMATKAVRLYNKNGAKVEGIVGDKSLGRQD